jgi:hypothetical protein
LKPSKRYEKIVLREVTMNQQSSAGDFGGFAKLGAENFAKILQELNDFLEETNRHWIARAKSEAEIRIRADD